MTGLSWLPFAVIALFTLLLAGCGQMQKRSPAEKTDYVHVSFKQLNGWNQQKAEQLKISLLNSCTVFKKRTGMVNSNPIFGTYRKWHHLCAILTKIPENTLKTFFENYFQPYQVNPGETGLFTGYYTPVYPGSLTRSAHYPIPVFKTPDDLVRINLKQFDNSHNVNGNNILYGKVEKGWMRPYDDRNAINRRFEKGDYRQDVLCWLKNPVDRLFLQIQGSGYIQLPSGKKVLMQFASKNGQPYYPIGRYLKENNLLQDVSMQTIKQWLKDNPSRIQEVLDLNKSFAFFRKSSRPPLGALGVPVTKERSIAVDPGYIPLGYPVWIASTLTANNTPYHKLFVAQDTGSAIKGAVRADIYFGAGKQAAWLAGHQNAPGRLFILIPR